jgi:uncharacterized protein (TIGR00730 family)
MPRRRRDDYDQMIKDAQQTLESDATDLRSLLCKDLLANALKCQRDELDILDLKLLNRAMAEFRHAATVFKPYRRVRKVSIFGSARVGQDTPSYRQAAELGRVLAESGFMVITGAADGIMRAGIEGAGAKNSFGVNILLPFEEGPNQLIKDDPKVMRFKYFFVRKIFFVMEAHAIVLFPGGFGTLDEGFEVLTLLQTGKSPPIPVVLMETPGEHYWETWDAFVRGQLLDRGYISPEDLSFYRIMHSPQEATRWISNYYSTYHSMRQVRDDLVIRLERELSDKAMEELNDTYFDLVRAGSIARTRALPEDFDETAVV